MTEEWKPVLGYESRYEVSNIGSVRTVARVDSNGRFRRCRLRKPQVSHDGYFYVILRKEDGIKLKKIHQLVIEAFVGPRPNGCVVRHLDGNQKNNHVVNLKWGTPKENNQDCVNHGRTYSGSKHWNIKLTEQEAIDIMERFKRGERQAFLAREYKISKTQIGNIVKGKSWRHIQFTSGASVLYNKDGTVQTCE